jgi:hypothetical protein
MTHADVQQRIGDSTRKHAAFVQRFERHSPCSAAPWNAT